MALYIVLKEGISQRELATETTPERIVERAVGSVIEVSDIAANGYDEVEDDPDKPGSKRTRRVPGLLELEYLAAHVEPEPEPMTKKRGRSRDEVTG